MESLSGGVSGSFSPKGPRDDSHRQSSVFGWRGSLHGDNFFSAESDEAVLPLEVGRADDLSKIHVAIHTATNGSFLHLSDDSWRWVWEVGVLFTSVYYALMVPYTLVYDVRFSNQSYFELLLSASLLVDVYLQFNTSFAQNGTLVANTTRIRVRYLRTWFASDVLSALPMDLLALLILGERSTGFKALHVLRLFRLFGVKRLFLESDCESVTEAHVWWIYRCVPMIRITCYLTVGVHWLALMRVGIIWEADAPESGGRDYITALYWVTYTLTAVGYGDISVASNPERIQAIFLFLVGILANGFVVGSLTRMLNRSDVKTERNDKMRETLALLQHFKVPKILTEEALSFRYHQLKSMIGTGPSVLDGFPRQLSEDISIYIKVKFISLAPIFDAATDACRIELGKALELRFWQMHTTIIECGGAATEMFFISHGFADILTQSDGQMYSRVIKKGDFFGEASLLVGTSDSTVYALSYCELYTLSKVNFIAILEEYPEFRIIIQNKIEEAESELKQPGGQEASCTAPVTPSSEANEEVEMTPPEIPQPDSEKSTPATSPTGKLGGIKMATTNRLKGMVAAQMKEAQQKNQDNAEPPDGQPDIHHFNGTNTAQLSTPSELQNAGVSARAEASIAMHFRKARMKNEESKKKVGLSQASKLLEAIGKRKTSGGFSTTSGTKSPMAGSSMNPGPPRSMRELISQVKKKAPAAENPVQSPRGSVAVELRGMEERIFKAISGSEERCRQDMMSIGDRLADIEASLKEAGIMKEHKPSQTFVTPLLETPGGFAETREEET